MKQAFLALSRSRKAQVSLAGIICTLVLLATGQISADVAASLVTGQLGVLVAAIAYEDGQMKSAPSSVNVGQMDVTDGS